MTLGHAHESVFLGKALGRPREAGLAACRPLETPVARLHVILSRGLHTCVANQACTAPPVRRAMQVLQGAAIVCVTVLLLLGAAHMAVKILGRVSECMSYYISRVSCIRRRRSVRPSFAYSLCVHSFHARRDRAVLLPPCSLCGAATLRPPPLGPGRGLTLPCGWNDVYAMRPPHTKIALSTRISGTCHYPDNISLAQIEWRRACVWRRGERECRHLD